MNLYAVPRLIGSYAFGGMGSALPNAPTRFPLLFEIPLVFKSDALRLDRDGQALAQNYRFALRLSGYSGFRGIHRNHHVIRFDDISV